MNELPADLAVDRDGRVIYPLLHPTPPSYDAVAYRHYTSILTTWNYAAGWSSKLVQTYLDRNKVVVNWRIPGTPTFLLLILKKDMPNGR